MAIELIAQLDPHSVYIPADELELVNNELEGSFSESAYSLIYKTTPSPLYQSSVVVLRKKLVYWPVINRTVDDSLFVGKNISNKKSCAT